MSIPIEEVGAEDTSHVGSPGIGAVGSPERGAVECKSEDAQSSRDAAGVPLDAAVAADTYNFQAAHKQLRSMSDREMRDRWEKWNLDKRRCVKTFQFYKRFEQAEASAFITDFFKSSDVLEQLHGYTRSGDIKTFPGGIVGTSFESVRATETSMAFFDRLTEAGITMGDRGYIQKQLDDIIDGVTIPDKLRDALLNPESLNSELYSETERGELLYQLFKMVVTGGAMCQYEDEASPYLEATKQLYKDLLAVGKDASGNISVQSHVYAIKGLQRDRVLPCMGPILVTSVVSI